MLAKLEFYDTGKSTVVFSATHPSTRKSGGARDFYGRVVGVPTDFLKTSTLKAARLTQILHNLPRNCLDLRYGITTDFS
ncbi:hypothetical protein JWG45_08430 [Leptospira sp. 201903070]|uniref:Uncharacterized protein n=1 Tax=Leptospira ainlahdjerensis TaxID=2810033 RepID=A0ABS2U9X9_9LEPT|nr:hypothetical protein [Leptospira ainlahdjerensis]MBM9577176.1 hypothetical protein [Leptospira ainlahdjerensis]